MVRPERRSWIPCRAGSLGTLQSRDHQTHLRHFRPRSSPLGGQGTCAAPHPRRSDEDQQTAEKSASYVDACFHTARSRTSLLPRCRVSHILSFSCGINGHRLGTCPVTAGSENARRPRQGTERRYSGKASSYRSYPRSSTGVITATVYRVSDDRHCGAEGRNLPLAKPLALSECLANLRELKATPVYCHDVPAPAPRLLQRPLQKTASRTTDPRESSRNRVKSALFVSGAIHKM
jgi:hypothetical protein